MFHVFMYFWTGSKDVAGSTQSPTGPRAPGTSKALIQSQHFQLATCRSAAKESQGMPTASLVEPRGNHGGHNGEAIDVIDMIY